MDDKQKIDLMAKIRYLEFVSFDYGVASASDSSAEQLSDKVETMQDARKVLLDSIELLFKA